MISQLQQQLTDLTARVRRNNAVNVNGRHLKQAVIDTASGYFSDYRKEVLGILGDSEALAQYDEDWQQLLRLAQANNAKSSYESTFRRLTRATNQLAVVSHSTVQQPPAVTEHRISYSDAERILFDTLRNLVPSAAASYQQGVADLGTNQSRHSYRGTAAEFREALRETLDHLAPDKDVTEESWYQPEEGQTRPTMKQKVKFILSSRGKNKTQRTAAEKTVDLIETLSGDIARAVYNRASLSAHVETTRDEVMQLKRYLDALFFDLLEIGQSTQQKAS